MRKGKDVVFHHDDNDAPSSPDQEDESPKRLCLNNKQFNVMSTKSLAGPFPLDPTKRYFVHSLSIEFDDGFAGSIGLYAHVGPYRVEVALGTKPSFRSASRNELAETDDFECTTSSALVSTMRISNGSVPFPPAQPQLI